MPRESGQSLAIPATVRRGDTGLSKRKCSWDEPACDKSSNVCVREYGKRHEVHSYLEKRSGFGFQWFKIAWINLLVVLIWMVDTENQWFQKVFLIIMLLKDGEGCLYMLRSTDLLKAYINKLLLVPFRHLSQTVVFAYKISFQSRQSLDDHSLHLTSFRACAGRGQTEATDTAASTHAGWQHIFVIKYPRGDLHKTVYYSQNSDWKTVKLK